VSWRGRWARARSEDGSAIVEFVFLGVLMLVPLVYLVMSLARVQAGSYAVTTAAREAGRAFVTAQAGQDAAARARAASDVAFSDQGFDGRGSLEIACSTSPCLTPEARVETTARVTVPLPLIPAFARDVVPLEIPLTASHLSTVDRFRGAS
jgi:Flp pilus assembly protein TadG